MILWYIFSVFCYVWGPRFVCCGSILKHEESASLAGLMSNYQMFYSFISVLTLGLLLGSWTEGYIGNGGFARIIFALVISKTPNPHRGQCLRQEDIHNQIMGILTHEDRECLYSLCSPYSILPLLKNIRKIEATSWKCFGLLYALQMHPQLYTRDNTLRKFWLKCIFEAISVYNFLIAGVNRDWKLLFLGHLSTVSRA